MRPGLLDLLLVFEADVRAEREVNVRIDDRVSAVKFLVSDADDGHGVAVGFHFSADEVSAASESFLPIGIAKDDDWIGAGGLSFAGKDEPTERRLEA